MKNFVKLAAVAIFSFIALTSSAQAAHGKKHHSKKEHIQKERKIKKAQKVVQQQTPHMSIEKSYIIM